MKIVAKPSEKNKTAAHEKGSLKQPKKPPTSEKIEKGDEEEKFSKQNKPFYFIVFVESPRFLQLSWQLLDGEHCLPQSFTNLDSFRALQAL